MSVGTAAIIIQIDCGNNLEAIENSVTIINESDLSSKYARVTLEA